MSTQEVTREGNQRPSWSVIAADLGGTKLKVAVVDDRLRQSHAIYREIVGLPYDDVIRTTVEAVATLAAQHPEIAGVGVAVAGQVDERTGRVSHREIRRGEAERGIAALAVHEYPLTDLIEERVALPAYAENDGIASVLAEWRAGVARGKDNIVCLVAGTYLGAGVAARGHIVRRRTSGPLLGGVVTQDPTTHELQYLGVLVGGHAVEVLMAGGRDQISITKGREDTVAPLNAAAIAERARAGDSQAQRSIETVAASLRIACINAINEWDPEVLVLAGGLMGASDLLLPGLPAFIEKWRLPGVGETGPEVRLARFGADTGLIGAAIWAFENLDLPIAPEG